MRLTCIICTVNLIILGICGGIYAFTGFNILLFACFYSYTAMKCFLAICAVSALFALYYMIVLKPFKGLK